jgi:hypothetical protein
MSNVNVLRKKCRDTARGLFRSVYTCASADTGAAEKESNAISERRK